jgi:tRNA U34 2-thiouridine synthase MnmA/TrmU
VVVGSRDDLEVTTVELREITWSNGHIGDGPMTAQFRAHGDPVAAKLRGTSLMFDEAQHAVSPGQTVAFYEDEKVLGGGLISRTNL